MCKVLAVLGALMLLTAAASAQDMPDNSATTTAANALGWAHSELPIPAIPASAALPLPRPSPPYAASGEFELYPWQVSLGYSFVRFKFIDNSHINYSGLDTSLSYFFTHYVAVEGDVTPGFGSYRGGGAKFASYGGGLRVARRTGHRWEPWGHAIVGRANVYPQAKADTSGLAVQAGGGYDYRMTPRLSFRGEGDWLHTRLYNTTQNNVKIVLGFVFNF